MGWFETLSSVARHPLTGRLPSLSLPLGNLVHYPVASQHAPRTQPALADLAINTTD